MSLYYNRLLMAPGVFYLQTLFLQPPLLLCGHSPPHQGGMAMEQEEKQNQEYYVSGSQRFGPSTPLTSYPKDVSLSFLSLLAFYCVFYQIQYMVCYKPETISS